MASVCIFMEVVVVVVLRAELVKTIVKVWAEPMCADAVAVELDRMTHSLPLYNYCVVGKGYSVRSG